MVRPGASKRHGLWPVVDNPRSTPIARYVICLASDLDGFLMAGVRVQTDEVDEGQRVSNVALGPKPDSPDFATT